MKIKNLYLFTLCALAATAVLAAEGEGETPSTDEPEFNRVVENYSNPDGMVDDVVENLYATGGDAANYGVFYVTGENVIVKSDANFANRNGQAYLWVSEGCSVTFLPASGVWNENFYGDGSGHILLDQNATMTIGSAEQAADLNNHNEAVVNLESGSLLSVSGNFNNNGSAQVYLKEGSTLEIENELWINGSSQVNVSGASIKAGSSTCFAQEANAVLNLTNSTLETSSFAVGLWSSKAVDSTINLASSTIYTSGDSTNWGTINVGATSRIVFGESGRALFNRGLLTIKSGQSLDISRVREEGSDDSYLCNYGTITIEAATDPEALAAISVQNFVDDGNAGVIIIDFSNVAGIQESREYALISANLLSIGSTEFKYTLDGIIFKDIELGSQVEDGALSLEITQEGAKIFYVYSIVPEPGTCAAIFGALALALACCRRRAARS